MTSGMRAGMAFGERREGGQIIRTWTDPCPVCGAEVTSIDVEAITVKDNPQALITIPDPYCPHEDDDAAECTCTVLINPAANPLFDEVHVVGHVVTLEPCGHQHQGQFRIYQQAVPVPGTLGALMADWAGAED